MTPFKSEAQRGFMFSKHPKIAKRWADEYPNQGKLPMHKANRKKGSRKIVGRKGGKLVYAPGDE